MNPRRLIGTVLAPHNAVQRQFQVIGAAAQHGHDVVQLGIGQAEGAVQGLGRATHDNKLLGHQRGLAHVGSRNGDVREDETLEQHPTVGTAEQRRHRALRVGHEPHDVALSERLPRVDGSAPLQRFEGSLLHRLRHDHGVDVR